MRRILKFSANYLPFIVETYARFFVFFSRKGMQKKSISIINTHDQGGGAAKVAFHIMKNSTLSDQMNLFVSYKKTENNKVVALKQLPRSRFQNWLEEMERLQGWLDLSRIAPLQLIRNRHFQQSDIVHLHNLHGSYFSYAIVPALVRKKKVIWTLHDEQLLTGHCSCTLGCDKWKSGCGNCPHLETYPAVKIDNTKRLFEAKKNWLKKINPVIVCPSNWLSDRVKIAYPFLQHIKVIPNGVDVEVFKPLDKKVIRKKLGLPVDAFLILFAAELSTLNPFKGGEIIDQLITEGLGKSTFMITIGGETEKQTESHIPFGYISDEYEMASLYAASDLMLYPTRADNLPLVVLEAMSCGLPVIASSLGGIPEIIQDKENGFLVQSYHNSNGFREAIGMYQNLSVTEKEIVSGKARTTIQKNYSSIKMINAYDELYAVCRESVKS